MSRPEFLRGRSHTGTVVHAVRPLDHDARPLGHAHYRFRPAMCGAMVKPGPYVWTPNVARACKRCVEVAS